MSVLYRLSSVLFGLTAVLLFALPAVAEAPQDSHDSVPSPKSDLPSDIQSMSPGIEPPSTARTDRLVKRAREQNWGPDRLFEYLQLDDIQDCRLFDDRTYLRERHARWREAVGLLARIDSDALHAWLLGLDSPPRIPTEERDHQLRCLFDDLVAAGAGDQYDIRLFLNISDQLGDRFQTVDQVRRTVRNSEYWLDRMTRVLTRSAFRNIHGQASIWHRKFRFAGRAFNRISDETADRCSLGHGGLWRPSNERHRHCWHHTLSSTQREREILQASAAPGLSRHHWGSDIDILSLNPVYFREDALLYDDWRWLNEHGLDYGFFQTYGAPDDEYAHMEERWHWSYYPVGQALWDYIYHHPVRFEEALFEQWDRLESRWNPHTGPYFDHLREYWREYLFNIDIPTVWPDESTEALDRRRRPVSN